MLRSLIPEKQFKKIEPFDNSALQQFIADYVELCGPAAVFIQSDIQKDLDHVRKASLEGGEEMPLGMRGHTLHFDGYYDQARDESETKFLLPRGMDLGPNINAIDRESAMEEIHGLFKGSMKGKTMYVQFFCLGPTRSEFSLPAVQITDSAYVAHSQNLLYRQGYGEFEKLGSSSNFFKFVHSAGELFQGRSKNVEKRRVYIDITRDVVYSINTQYGGNTIGHKKLAMRLAIKRGSEENWLTEHMFLMGVHGPHNRVTYFTGAFPSLCGKTSTAMLPGETIIGDDIVYMRAKDGVARAVNVEKGMFGIIQGVNAKDDPIIWKALHTPGEIIFSNVLLTDKKQVYWAGKDAQPPAAGTNFAGEWTAARKGPDGKDIPLSHPNARFTLSLDSLENVGDKLEDPDGVVVGGVIYGGRDSDTWVPIEQAFNWEHGIITKGAALESETTAAALGKTGVRKFNPMANLSFLSIPLGRYIENNLRFGQGLSKPPVVFSVNYFIQGKDGAFLNGRMDKKVWLKWAELRVHNTVEAIRTPSGFIPRYEELKKLFKQVLRRDYTADEYVAQFTLRIPENIAKIDRIVKIYREKVTDAPARLFVVLEEQRERFEKLRKKKGDYVSPLDMA